MRPGTLRRRTPMKPTGWIARHKQLNTMSAKARRERRAAQPVVDAVFARDGGCLLRGHAELAGPCFGHLTPHHTRKAWKKPGWTPEGLVALCSCHNDWCEDEPVKAHALGLVVWEGESFGHSWAAMRNAGLPVPERLLVRCGGSLAKPDSLRLVTEDRCGCPVCGMWVCVETAPDGGPDAFIAEHEREVRP